MAILTMISYHDVAFSFDSEFLVDVLQECQVSLHLKSRVVLLVMF